jgi:light-regulated signal transduction histidine kinase (bacteriophytochrome)
MKWDRPAWEIQRESRETLTREKGRDLGLPWPKKFVELHGRKIWVESEVGRGFSFSLPVVGDNDMNRITVRLAPQ